MTIQLQEVAYATGKQQLFTHLNLQLDQRPTLILGLNGAGKTTLLRLAAGELTPTNGRVWNEVQVAYLPQHVPVIPGFTCEEYVAYVAWVSGAEQTRAHQQAAGWLEFVGLGRQRGQMCHKLSGGQQTRLGLAAALNSGAKMLLLDEPSAALDPLAREMLEALYQRVIAAGIGLVVSTHHGEDITNYFQRLIVVDAGTIIFDDVPSAFARLQGGDSILSRLARAVLR